ncbi:MAG: ABC transporter ATP-binding protein [Geminicoccales bacterium]
MTAILDIKDLEVTFRTAEGLVRAVDGISYSIAAGETVAIVGESGSGKSMGALAILGLVPSPPGEVRAGHVRFGGRDLARLDDAALRPLRGREIAMIFQEPMTSLNPVLSIGTQLTEAMQLHLGFSKKEATARAIELLALVGISEPERRLRQYPHHFSGGMRQRVMIAQALSCEPKLIIADEPTTALDVTIQAQILELIKDLTRRFGVALILITHNLGLVARYADRVNVMYAGRILETAVPKELYHRPRHPYTIGLMASQPRMDRVTERLVAIEGQPPDLARLDQGCAFQPRCRFAIDRCASSQPSLEDMHVEHRSACFRRDELDNST